MKKSLVLTMAAISAIAVSGCATKSTMEMRVVEKNNYVLLSGAEASLSPRMYLAPPDPDAYLALSFDQRESILTEYVFDLYTAVGVCEADKATALGIIQRQKKEIEKLRETEEARVNALVQSLKDKE